MIRMSRQLFVILLWLCSSGLSSFQRKKQSSFKEIAPKCWLFILLGAAASGAGHVLVYKALFLGKAAVIMTIYRMGMVISIILSRIFLHEKLQKKGWFGFALFGGRRRALCSGKIKVCSDEVDRMNVVVFVQKREVPITIVHFFFSLLLIDIAAILVA